jgi:hypothetical protein
MNTLTSIIHNHPRGFTKKVIQNLQGKCDGVGGRVKYPEGWRRISLLQLRGQDEASGWLQAGCINKQTLGNLAKEVM